MKKPAKAKKSAKKSVKKKAVKVKASAYYAQSKRLGFRSLEASDEALYCDLFTDAKTLEYVCPPLSPERAAQSFQKALEVTACKPLRQRISVIIERASKKPLGIASIKLIDAEKRHAEGGILLKPSAHAQRFAIEGSLALISAAFRRHSIDELHALVPLNHKAGERLVIGSGYARGSDLAATHDRPARSSWYIKRESWAENFK